MKVYYFPNIKNIPANASFVLGGFESIHKGHLELIKTAKSFKDSFVVVCMFEKPDLLPSVKDKKILQLDIRLEYLAELNIDAVILLPFNDWLKNLSAKEFIDLLIKSGASRFIVGSDFKFGKNAQFSSKDLKNIFNNTFIVNLLQDETKHKISTSILKEELVNCNLDFFNKNLAFKYRIKTILTSWTNRNLFWPDDLFKICSGIYFVNILFAEKEYHGVLFLDIKNQIHLEVLDQDFQDLPLTYFEIEFLKFSRKTYNNITDKITNLDLKNAFTFFKNRL